MDIDLENRVNRAIEELKSLSPDQYDFNEMDPVARMLFIAMLNEVQKIDDHIDTLCQQIVDKYCTDFIPGDKVSAIPAIAIIAPRLKAKKDAVPISIGNGAVFSYKIDVHSTPLNYVPLFTTTVLPYDDLFVLSHSRLSHLEESVNISMRNKNRMWIGITMPVEVECLTGVSMLIKGTHGIVPERILTGDNSELEFSTIGKMENIEMAEPFDAQQTSGAFFTCIEAWKERLLNMENATLLYITDKLTDRDIFKPRTFPNCFKQELEDDVLNCFKPNTVWLQVEFPDEFALSSESQVIINALPVINVDQNVLTLTQATPIAKLQRQEGSFFLSVTETSASGIKQGFGETGQDIIIRDFDAHRYHDGDLYRDVRNLYNRFIDDYYAFIEYNGIKDGEALRQLRQTINQIGKSVGSRNAKFKFDSGTYVMKNMNQEQDSSAVKVSYLTTQGRIGNTPQAGQLMENKGLPAIEQKVEIAVGAMGGCDKATPDEQYELLRYFTLTNDRLYTKMDVDAFLRKEIIAEFGKEEFRRINIKISIEGASGPSSLRRGLYVDIEFKDKKNYEKAISQSLKTQLLQRIENKSCIAMPIIINLINLDKNENA